MSSNGTNATGNSTTDAPSNGSGGGIIAFNLPMWMAMAAFTGIAWYNVVELLINIYMTFKKRRGLYFWSLMVASFGVIGHSTSLLLKFFTNANVWGVGVLLMFGWWSMVTGQSVVLYSRLHLVVRDTRVLKGVLIMIIVDGICLHVPTSVMTYGSSSDLWYLFVTPFSYMERIQMTIFVVQEAIISGIYVYYTIKLIKPAMQNGRKKTRSVMLQLIWINVFIVCLDLAMLGMEYHGDYQVEASLKSMIYSIKLKLEFAVLNQLMRLASSTVNAARSNGMQYGSTATVRANSATADDAPRSRSLSYWNRVIQARPSDPVGNIEANLRGDAAAGPSRKGSTVAFNQVNYAGGEKPSAIQVSKEVDVQYSAREVSSEADTRNSDSELRDIEE